MVGLRGGFLGATDGELRQIMFKEPRQIIFNVTHGIEGQTAPLLLITDFITNKPVDRLPAIDYNGLDR